MREWTENRGRKTRQEAVGESPRSGRESQDRDTGKGYRKDRLKRHFEGKINRIWYLNQETNQRPFLTLDTGLKGKKTANTEKFKWESRFRRCVGNPPPTPRSPSGRVIPWEKSQGSAQSTLRSVMTDFSNRTPNAISRGKRHKG